MAALSLGTSTLRTLISSPTLSLKHIEATTTAFSDTLADADDINQAIDMGGVALPSGQEVDAELELREMVEAAEVVERNVKAAEEHERKVVEDAKRKDAVDKAREEGERLDREETQERERRTDALLEGVQAAPSEAPASAPQNNEGVLVE